MLIHYVGLQAAHLAPQITESLVSSEGPGAGDEHDLRVLGLDRPGEAFVSFDVLRPPLLVADADHLQVEWRRMAHRGALASPRAGRGAVGEFDQVERV